MRRFGCVQSAGIIISVFLFLVLPACGGHKPPGANPFPAKITLNPATSASMQLGSTLLFTAAAQNATNANISPAFTYSLTPDSPSGILDISPAGFACAGSWNAPYYNVCTPAGTGTVNVVASALGATSPPTLVFVHPAIDNIQISVMPPVNSPPPACPTQTALPLACNIKFNPSAANYCLSQNQTQTLQATAYSQGVDITASVGPFTWTQANANVVTITPIVTSSANVATNQATVVPSTPGETQVVATASGVSSQPYIAETCPVQCIALQIGSNFGQTGFITNKGTSESITATAVDVQGCIVPKPALTWTSSAPAALTAGSATTGCAGSTTCTVSTAQPGAAAITASCTPPTCNVGFPLVPAGLPTLYVPQPVYPVTAISGLVTGATSATSVLATSQDCYSSSLCTVALYDISTSKNIAASPTSMPTPPNSLMFDPAGDKIYSGSQYGALLITTTNLGSSTTSPFASLPAAGTTLGLVTGKVIAVSPNGNLAVFSDTVSTPNQVYVVNTSSAAAATPLNINSATTAAFSPDSSKAFILGNGGNTLYIYSPLQALQTIPLAAPANVIAFSSTGTFALLAGGSSDPSTFAIYNTCNNSPAYLTLPVQTPPIPPLPGPPIFLKMVPAGSAPAGNPSVPTLFQDDLNNLDVFVGVDSTGIDVIATTTTTPLTPPAATLCPVQQIAFAAQAATPNPAFYPLHINLLQGTFNPINFFVSPSGSEIYIVTSDQGVLVYNFGTQSVSTIPLSGGAAPVAADMTVDGTLLYVAGTDGILHELNTVLALDVLEIPFFQLPNSTNNFCYQNYTCSLDLVAMRP
ncbi:MAG: WD40 repeat domain-containing protein [Candidatus Sulfotelmatobacter sp.]